MLNLFMFLLFLSIIAFYLNSSAIYFNYKGCFNIILMTICDARYVLTHINIGSYGSNNDSGVFRNSKMWEQLFENKVHLPEADSFEESSISEKVPYHLVRDEAFALQSWLLRPYLIQGIPEGQAIFNYGLSKTRRVTENAFWILSAHWRIFMRRIQNSVDSMQMIVRAAVILHNFLRQTSSAGYCPGGFADSCDSSWKKEDEVETRQMEMCLMVEDPVFLTIC